MLEITFLILAVLNGGWMVFDGVHVMLKGKYVGPPQPGPWSKLVSKLGINPLSLGPLFVGLGILWLVAAFGLINNAVWGWSLALLTSACTLWYISAGTVLSVLAIVVLLLI